MLITEVRKFISRIEKLFVDTIADTPEEKVVSMKTFEKQVITETTFFKNYLSQLMKVFLIIFSTVHER